MKAALQSCHVDEVEKHKTEASTKAETREAKREREEKESLRKISTVCSTFDLTVVVVEHKSF